MFVDIYMLHNNKYNIYFGYITRHMFCVFFVFNFNKNIIHYTVYKNKNNAIRQYILYELSLQ